MNPTRGPLSLINLANRYARATVPRQVGQMSELMREFRESGRRSFDQWVGWYSERCHDSVDKAVKLIMCKLSEFKRAIEE